MVTHPVRRALASALVTIALVAVLVLVPQATRVSATGLMGALRSPGDAAFIAGHRGDRASAPENTLPAFSAAFASGFDFVEADLQLSADGHAVLIHDETVDRTTDGTGLVAELTLEELRALDAGSWYAPEFRGTVIPTFHDFLDIFVEVDQKAILEIKGYWTVTQLRVIVDEIYWRGVQDRVVLASFDLSSVAHLAEAAPALPRLIIRRDLPSDPVGLAEHYGAIGVLTSGQAIQSDPEVVERMHEAGLRVLAYTLNNQKRWSEALASGVDGIVTDKPSKLDAWIARTAPGT